MKFVLLCVLVALCVGVASAQVNAKALLKDLRQNRNKWRKLGLTTYKLKETRTCFCLPEFVGPFDVTVVNDKITNVAFSPGGSLSGTPDSSLKNILLTIEGAFSRVEQRINEGVARVNVEYDPTLFYITSFFIDIDERIADEEESFSFELLTPVGGPTPPIIPVPPILPPVIPGPAPGPSSKDRTLVLTAKVNRKKWETLGPKSYKYRLRRICFCFGGFSGPFLITVKDGKIIDVVFEGPGAKPDKIDVPTIDGLFDLILKEAPKVDEITVTYDRILGYPTNISIDRIKLAIDDEITYTAELIEGQGIFGTFPGADIKPFKLRG